MDKQIFRTIEGKLYNYFLKNKRITSLNKKIEVLELQIESIEEDLRTTNIKIPEESSSPQFGERVQSSPSGASYAERTMLNIISRKEREIADLKDEISRAEEKIRKIIADYSTIESYIEQLESEEYKAFLKLKYDKEFNEMKIGKTLGMSQPTVNRIRQRIVNDIANWD